MSIKRKLVTLTAISKGCPFPEMEHPAFENQFPVWDKRNWTEKPTPKRIISNRLQLEDFLNTVSRTASTKTKWWLKYVLTPYLTDDYDKVESVKTLTDADDYGDDIKENFDKHKVMFRIIFDSKLENLVSQIVQYLNSIASELDDIKFTDALNAIIDRATNDSKKTRGFLESVKVQAQAFAERN